jgi:hypothetical protein
MSVITVGPNFLSNFFDRRRASSEQSHTIDGALGLLLPSGSMLRDWQRHPGRRAQLHNLLADNPLQCTLLVMDAKEFEELYHGKYEEGSVFQSIAANETLTFPWVLLEPLHSDDPKALKFRKWNQSSVVFFDEFHQQDLKAVVENPSDKAFTPRRRWSPDALLLCHILREKFMSADSEKIIKGVLVQTLKTKLKYAAGATLAIGVVACSVAAAVCTGTGAITLSTTLAQSIIKGAASSAGGRVGDAATAALAGGAAGAAVAAAAARAKEPMPPIVDEATLGPMELLQARVDRLEHAMFVTQDKGAVQKAGDAVAQALKAVRASKTN